jgi:hypothetical protein
MPARFRHTSGYPQLLKLRPPVGLSARKLRCVRAAEQRQRRESASKTASETPPRGASGAAFADR